MALSRVGLALRANLAASQVGARLRRVRSPRYADHLGGPLSTNEPLGRYAVPTLPDASAAFFYNLCTFAQAEGRFALLHLSANPSPSCHLVAAGHESLPLRQEFYGVQWVSGWGLRVSCMALSRVGLALRANLAASQVGARLRRVRSPRFADHLGGPLSMNATLGRYAVPTLPSIQPAT